MDSDSIDVSPTIHTIRGQRVVLDQDLAKLFGTETRRINEQVRRNEEKFGDDFAFRLTDEEFQSLKSQSATSNKGRGGRRHPPTAFTEHGVVMAATILSSPQAISATRLIVRTFVAAEKEKLAAVAGRNLPATLETKSLIPIADEMRHGLMGKINTALGRVLDAIADPLTQTTVRDEARQLVSQGLQTIKDHLKVTGIQNEKVLAEVRKLLAEADAIDADTQQKHVDAKHRELALLAKQLRLVLGAQRYLETGTADSLETVLKDLAS